MTNRDAQNDQPIPDINILDIKPNINKPDVIITVSNLE